MSDILHTQVGVREDRALSIFSCSEDEMEDIQCTSHNLENSPEGDRDMTDCANANRAGEGRSAASIGTDDSDTERECHASSQEGISRERLLSLLVRDSECSLFSSCR